MYAEGETNMGSLQAAGLDDRQPLGLQRHQQSDGTQRETEHLSSPVWQIPGARSSLPRYSIECYRLRLMPASSL